MNNKYMFFKGMYKECVIVFESKGRLKSVGLDKKLIKYINKGIVDYIVIDSSFNTWVSRCKNNRYNELLIREYLRQYISKKSI